MKTIEVVASVIVKDNKVFCCKRGPGRDLEGYYEFPGGKIEVNETKEEALIRELKEELEINVEIEKYFTTVLHEYNAFAVNIHYFICKINDKHLNMKVHNQLKLVLAFYYLDELKFQATFQLIIHLRLHI